MLENQTKVDSHSNPAAPSVRMIENPPEIQERFQRYRDFDTFQEKAEKMFNAFRDSDYRARVYEDFNKLEVTPGGRWGGNERDCVEVFWGSKIYDSQYKQSNIRHFKFLVESGVNMSFIRSPKGFVNIYLCPAAVEKDTSHNEGEEISIYKENIDPSNLNEDWYMRDIWRDFMAFSEVTHLDGKPTFGQTLRIWWLRLTKPYLVNGKRESSRFYSGGLWILKWVFTVGLSGVLLLAINTV